MSLSACLLYSISISTVSTSRLVLSFFFISSLHVRISKQFTIQFLPYIHNILCKCVLAVYVSFVSISRLFPHTKFCVYIWCIFAIHCTADRLCMIFSDCVHVNIVSARTMPGHWRRTRPMVSNGRSSKCKIYIYWTVRCRNGQVIIIDIYDFIFLKNWTDFIAQITIEPWEIFSFIFLLISYSRFRIYQSIFVFISLFLSFCLASLSISLLWHIVSVMNKRTSDREREREIHRL